MSQTCIGVKFVEVATFSTSCVNENIAMEKEWLHCSTNFFIAIDKQFKSTVVNVIYAWPKSGDYVYKAHLQNFNRV